MRRMCFSAAVSLDGYIAGPKGEFDWIVMDPDIDFGSFMERFDTILLGRKSYEASQQHGGGGMPGMKSIVFSRTLDENACPGTILSNDPEGTVAALRKEPGKDIWLFGGGELFRSLLELHLVDTIELGVIPVLLGGGIPLLPHSAMRTSLKLISHKIYPKTGTVGLEYEPRHGRR